LRDEGTARRRGERGVARRCDDVRARPACAAACDRSRRGDDHGDASVHRQRDPLRPPTLTPPRRGTRPAPVRCRALSLSDARLFPVNVNCSILDRSRRFYTEGLGLTVGAHTAPESAQPGTAFGLDVARWDASILLGPRGFEGGAIDLLEWREPRPVG